tara:strand:- start:15611 stop:15802 length:192 start_codon:yes stop_codon:yes gene_type:complete
MNIETRPLFNPSHKMPPFYCEDILPIAEGISKKGLSLPSFPGLLPEQTIYICKNISNFFDGNT